MPAILRESEIPKVAMMLTQLCALDDSTLPPDLEPDEVALLSRHRRQKLRTALENAGIIVKADPEPDTIVNVEEPRNDTP